MCFFSIIVPVYKAEKYLSTCVDSIINQSFTDIEIILVDDGSPDGCPEICDKYAEKDKRIKVIHKQNGGSSSARNAGLERAEGQYVMFIDSDDYYDNLDALEKIYNKLCQKETEVLIIGIKKFMQNDSTFIEKENPDIPEDEVDTTKFLMKNNIFVASACDKIYSAKFIRDNVLRFVENQKGEDIEWCIKILIANPAIEILPENIYVYRKQNQDSVSTNIERKNVEDIFKVLKKYADVDSICLKHFLAVQFVQLLAITNLVPSKEIKDILKELKSFYYLLKFNWYPYVKKIRKVKFLGFDIIRKLIGIKVYGIKGCLA